MLLRREDFPTLHIGKRMLTPKHRFIQWIEENTKWACFLRQRTRWMQELLFSWFQPKGSLSRAALPKEHTPICLLPTATYRRTFLCFNVFLILAFGFIRDSHFDSARFQQRLQISLSKMLSVFKPQICHHFFPGPFFRTVCDQGFFFFIMRGNMHVVMRGILVTAVHVVIHIFQHNAKRASRMSSSIMWPFSPVCGRVRCWAWPGTVWTSRTTRSWSTSSTRCLARQRSMCSIQRRIKRLFYANLWHSVFGDKGSK